MEAQSALAFPAELIILMRQCPNSSRINLSASAWGWWVCSAFLACSIRHSHVASSTSFVTNVYGSLWEDENISNYYMQTEKVSQSCKVFELETPHFKQKKGLGGRSTNHYNLSCYNKMIRVLLWLVKRKAFQYLPAPLVITGVVRVSRSEICEDSLVLAAVCCCTLTSAASAKCISVFLSGLSSKFLQPTHLQMDEHMIFAFESKQEVYKYNQWFAFWSDKAPLKQLLKTHLVALAVVLQAAWPFAVAAFAVSAVRFALFAFANFRFEGLWVPVQTSLWKTHYLDSSV